MDEAPLRIRDLTRVRFERPHLIAEALASRVRGTLRSDQHTLIVAADHPARGSFAAGGDPLAMASRVDLLERCQTALAHPRVDGVLGAPDLIEDLALLGALDGKLVYGSMNRSGLVGTEFAVDDRVTAYDRRGIVDAGLDGGKILLRIDPEDPRTADVLERAGQLVSELSDHDRTIIIEPFMVRRTERELNTDLGADAVMRSIAIASGLGRTSARTWLKVPCVADMDRVLSATTLPTLLLGGAGRIDAALPGWARALKNPTVRGLVLGRALLFPSDGDVAGAIDRLMEVL